MNPRARDPISGLQPKGFPFGQKQGKRESEVVSLHEALRNMFRNNQSETTRKTVSHAATESGTNQLESELAMNSGSRRQAQAEPEVGGLNPLRHATCLIMATEASWAYVSRG